MNSEKISCDDNESNFAKVNKAASELQYQQGMVPLHCMMSLEITENESEMQQFLEALEGFTWLDEKKTVGWFKDKTRNFAHRHATHVLGDFGKRTAFSEALSAQELYAAYCAHVESRTERKVQIQPEDLMHFVKTALSLRIGVDIQEGSVYFLDPASEQAEDRKVQALVEKVLSAQN